MILLIVELTRLYKRQKMLVALMKERVQSLEDLIISDARQQLNLLNIIEEANKQPLSDESLKRVVNLRASIRRSQEVYYDRWLDRRENKKQGG
jgi:replication-associated recombination protein RarA